MAIEKMYYPKLTYANSTIEGIFLFGILCLSNKIYGLESLYYIGNFQIMHMEETNKSHWETPLRAQKVLWQGQKSYYAFVIRLIHTCQ